MEKLSIHFLFDILRALCELEIGIDKVKLYDGLELNRRMTEKFTDRHHDEVCKFKETAKQAE